MITATLWLPLGTLTDLGAVDLIIDAVEGHRNSTRGHC
jgi:hypothetical protein